MTEYAPPSAGPTTRRFTVRADGSTSGDDGDSGRLAVSLRYACRVAGQLEFLAGVGDLEWVRTISGTAALTARVGWTQDHEVTVAAEVETGPSRTSRKVAETGGRDVQAALAHSLQRVRQMLGTHWSAVVAGDKRVVAASVPQVGNEVPGAMAALPEIGVRALAVLGALEGRYRETCVLLDYERGTLVVAALGDHALVAFADEVDTQVVAEIVDSVRGLLSSADIAGAPTVATDAPAKATAEASAAAAAEPAAAPSGPDRPPPGRRRLRGRRG